METYFWLFRLFFLLRSYPTYEEWKQYIIKDGKAIRVDSSYPTYEEWKLVCLKSKFSYASCSYPTYEEWKLATFIFRCLRYFRSYPTYEEWKPQMKFTAR